MHLKVISQFRFKTPQGDPSPCQKSVFLYPLNLFGVCPHRPRKESGDGTVNFVPIGLVLPFHISVEEYYPARCSGEKK